MTVFSDGPAKGRKLMLKRAPHFLRAAVDAQGGWDALDQCKDKPSPGETLSAYELTGTPGVFNVQIRGGCAGRSGFYAVSEYRFVKEQPSDAVMRDTALWRNWCQEHGPNE